jgi:CheY-like chemotaxis protein
MKQDPEVLSMSVLRILIVDDCPVVRQAVSLSLAGFNCKADFACNGLEAVSLVQQHHYDLVLMDVEMPVLDGLQATRMIRRMEGNAGLIPVIASAPAAICKLAGMNDYFVKPADYKTILRQWLPHFLPFEHHTR